MSNVGIYAGSFDMITKGHELVIQEVVGLFDHLIVAVAFNPQKKYMFTCTERMDLVKQVTSQYPNIQVTIIHEDTYLVDFANEIGAKYLVRGLRSEEDFRKEKTMRDVNSDFDSSIKTIFVMPDPDVAKVSSSMVKSLIGPNGWQQKIAKYVSEPVLAAIIRKVESGN